MALALKARSPSRSRRPPGVLVALGTTAALLVSCSPRTSLVPTGEHPPGAPEIIVPTPPPEARVEMLPLARGDGCRWLGGDYERVGSAWRFRKGRWVRAPRGCLYAVPTTRYEDTKHGTVLVHRPGVWFPQDPDLSCDAPLPCEEE